MKRWGGGGFYILAAMLLAGCSDQGRATGNDAYGCYQQNQRAVMMCYPDGECWVECREPVKGKKP